MHIDLRGTVQRWALAANVLRYKRSPLLTSQLRVANKANRYQAFWKRLRKYGTAILVDPYTISVSEVTQHFPNPVGKMANCEVNG